MSIANDDGWMPRLSEREVDVLRLLALGLSNREIADALTISNATAANHVTAIRHKLGVRNRTQAATWAVRHLSAASQDLHGGTQYQIERSV